ncbi:alpha/beta fold hydrolase [Virgibacillus necropolis]|uniref:Alpha/beta hydrolase n=1 Tax=Virgibacillus necropolis TaxID=163877 RepID=A0A221MFQ2_9BACI|nr:alpha/beta fold hydrolase [Virgibacillus necropolis]ASN06498.1 alpha/beta hydrolase [Virgibacillus necropolis]
MWKKQFIDTERGNFEVFTQGEGDPLCVTHLYSEFNALGYYFADIFVNHFTVYLINLKEAGNSCKVVNEEELSMQETAKDLESIREALHLKKWSFAGHSTGGMLGLIYADLYPDSLTKLLVGGASSTNKYMEHESSMYSQKSPLNDRLKEIFAVLKSTNSTMEERSKANKEWTNMSLYNVERRDEYFLKPSSGKIVHKRLNYYSFTELPNYNIKTKLPQVAIPSFVYCGRHDAQCPLVFSEEISRGVKNSRLYIFESSNHLPYLEEKSEFLAMVQDFKVLTENLL